MPRRTLQLIVAEGCNLRCEYCFERFKRPRVMSFETARRFIDEYLTAPDGHDEVMIDFMGGEPMLAFGLIKQVVEYLESRRWPKAYGFSMSTNGTLFDADNEPWFVEKKRVFTPMLSFDGTREAHDLNRSHSYDAVAQRLGFFREHWPHQPLKMTLDHRSLPWLADGVLNILALGFRVDLNLVFEDVWGTGEVRQAHLRLLERELARLVEFYSAHPDLEPPMLVKLPLAKCTEPERDPTTRWCGAGEAMVAIGIDGAVYPCHRFLDFSRGKALTMDEFHDLKQVQDPASPCATCPVVAACPTCAAHNWECSGLVAGRSLFKCEFIKLQMVATAAIAINRVNALLAAYQPNDLDDDALLQTRQQLAGSILALDVLADVPQAELRTYAIPSMPCVRVAKGSASDPGNPRP